MTFIYKKKNNKIKIYNNNNICKKQNNKYIIKIIRNQKKKKYNSKILINFKNFNIYMFIKN